jgi:hypothetical protein
VIETAHELVVALTADERAAVMGGAAVEVYDLPIG